MSAARGPSDAALDALAAELAATFLGWRLREDFDALAALGEGALRVDLLSGEAWCDGDPLPPLFIAGALRAALHEAREKGAAITAARLDAEFARRETWLRGEARPTLDLACRVTLRAAGREHVAEANNAAARR